ncbi:MAG TPA: FeoB-associated Cys-rich membrane protein [Candidatus Ventrousia excrementavium]|uniref:FeoB-associated Cys-rich membrane protein n=1 Tax=Candidatus Ventrousia excrementavium TaxID=2840961 RepID=A0A9D1IWB9_9CLOT|nr:FeoB-associated Cys-rich membrane protein [Candidatus Ventrousia excrementavium]
MNGASWVVLGLLVLSLGLALRALIRRRGCGCGCSGCTGKCRKGKQVKNDAENP